jgi:formylmethanofuran dehydrogenase subunit B
VIKSFLIESISDVELIDQDVQSINSSFDNENQHLAFEISETQSRLIKARRLSLRYQNLADITVFLQDEVDSSFVSTLISTFAESRRKEINELLKRQIFEIITISEVLKNVRIFNFRFVDEIKHSNISQTYEKSRLMIQAYNDHEKTLMLTQASTIQRMS